MNTYNRLTMRHILNLIEIQFQAALVSINIVCFLYAFTKFGKISVINSILYTLSYSFIFSCSTLINDLVDYTKANDKDYKENVNFIGKFNNNPRSVFILTIILLFFATLTGLFLVIRTNIFLLFIGAIGFLFAIAYTYGPFPISRFPLGELAVCIIVSFQSFVAVYIQNPAIMLIIVNSKGLSINVNMAEIFSIIIVFLPISLLVTNFMVINNLCDMKEDILNDRKTLSFYLGEKNSVKFFSIIFITVWLSVISLIYFNVLPLVSSIFFFFIPYSVYVVLYLNKHHRKGDKERNGKNLAILLGALIIVYFISFLKV